MSNSSPAHPAKPVRLTFEFHLAPAWIAQHVIDHGTRPAKEFEYKVDLTELDGPAERERFVKAHRAYRQKPGFPPLDGPSDDPEVIIAAVEAWLGDKVVRADAFGDEMARWVASRGSPRLKTAHERGYKVNATYARERAAVEFPRYWVDTNDSAWHTERTDPTLEALGVETDERRHAAEVGGGTAVPKIVWLRTPPADLAAALADEGASFDACEAILISNYLGRYALYLPLPYPREEE